MSTRLHKKLDKRSEEGTLRSLSSFEGMIDFISNDYLGCSKMQLAKTVRKGSTGSRLISGNSTKTEGFETQIADFFEYESGLCFNSGYDANLGIFSSIPQKGDVVLYDEHIHASVRDGLRLSNAKSYSFKHNDTADLERLLKKIEAEAVYIAIEGLYSMHGDIPPLNQIVDLAEVYGAKVILDEAHSAGVYGKDGKGLSSELVAKVYIKLVTYGKAYGGHGACVLTDDVTKMYLINFARPLIYSTALPDDSYEFMTNILFDNQLELNRKKLKSNLEYFRSKVEGLELKSDLNSPIQIIRFDTIGELQRKAEALVKQNIASKVMYPPTVKEGEECLRVCIHSFNTKDELNQLSRELLR